MKPAPFDYHAPSTVADVLTLIDGTEDAELIAGTQSLMFDMTTRNKHPDHLIDLGGVDELSSLTDTDESQPVIEHARLALANVADVPPVVQSVPDELEGNPLTESAAEAVEHAAIEAADPSKRVHTDGEFKPDIAGTYGRRAVERAYERAATDDRSE